MRLAWFRAAPPDNRNLLDETAPVIAALASTHELVVITAKEAHDVVWRHFRRPFDRFVYELGTTPAHAFMQAYLVHYPGIVARRGLGVRSVMDPMDPVASDASDSTRQRALHVGVLDRACLGVVQRAVERMRKTGAHADVLTETPLPSILAEADVLVTLEWPPLPGAPTAALLGMAAAKPVIVLEVEGTAGWPAFDPQTWRSRGFLDEPPIVVSLDPRDEEHSLMLALTRLAADATLRASLGAAAHAWWMTNATLEHAIRAWETAVVAGADADHQARTPRDGRERTRALLEPFTLPSGLLPGIA